MLGNQTSGLSPQGFSDGDGGMSVDKFVKNPEPETLDGATGSTPDIFSRPHSARIALYFEEPVEPEIYEVSSHAPGRFLELLVLKVAQLAKEQGGNIPLVAINEVIDNLVHADFAGATISILDGGNTLRVSDQGTGIAETKKVLRRGYSTAKDDERTFIKGVGAGLFLADQALRAVGGGLDIDGNLDGGTVVTLRTPRPQSTKGVPSVSPREKSQKLSLTKRQKQVFFIIIELGSVGPSRIAGELSVGLSTVYRDLGALAKAGLIETVARGRRVLTEEGLRCVDVIVGS